MIIEFFMDAIKSFFLFVIGLFPALPDMSFLSSSIDSIIRTIKILDLFLSVRIFGLCLVVLFVLTGIDFFWGIIMWVIRKIPGVQ